MKFMIAIATIAILAYKLLVPSLTMADLIPATIIVPLLTFVGYKVFTVFGK